MGPIVRTEKPVDADQTDELNDDDDRQLSDIYELRNCWYCEVFLPLFHAAKLINVGETADDADDDTDAAQELVPVCDGCYTIYGHGD